MIFNFDQETINRGKLVEPGVWYPVEITKFEAAKAKKDNSDLEKYTCKIISDDEEVKGVPLYFQFSEKAPGFAIPFIEAIIGEKVQKGVQYEMGQSVVGKQIEVFVSRGDYNGKPQNNVDNFRPIGG